MDPGSSPIMYRLVDSFQVSRLTGVYWTVTFAPIQPTTGSRDGSARHVVVTISDARHAALEHHGPNFTREEIAEMEETRKERPSRSHKRGAGGTRGDD